MANMPPKSLMNPPQQMGLIERILGGQSPYNTPGINPAAPSPTSPGAPPAGAGGFLGTPGGSFLMNLLAQSGYSTMPQSPLGAIGRAGIATQQQQMQQQDRQMRQRQMEMQNELIRQRIGLSNRPQRRVQSAQPLENGNIGYLDAFTGEVVDTGVKAGGRTQIVDIEGKGRFIFDPVQRSLTPVADEETVQGGISGRAGAERSATEQAEIDARNRESLPAEIQQAGEFIDQADKYINAFETGQLGSGPVEQFWRQFTPSGQGFSSFSGEQILNLISSATFGALSEGERNFLEGVTFNLGDDESVNIDKLKRAKRIVEGARKRAMEKMDRLEGNEFEGFEILGPK